MLYPDEVDKSGLPMTARAVFIIGPDKRLKLSLLYPATTGRNFKEVRTRHSRLLATCMHIHGACNGVLHNAELILFP